MFTDAVLNGTMTAWMAPLLPSQKAFYLYLLAALVIAGGSYVYFSYREETARPEGISKGFLGYVFDPKVWLHRSAKQDYMFFALNGLIYYGIIAQLLIFGHILFGAFGGGLEAIFGVRDAPVFLPTPLTAAAYTLAVLLAIDLAVWTTHYLQHKVEVLWQFHQVHHSAEVLTPATVYRMHPVDLLFTGLATIGLMGLATAGFTYMTQTKPSELTVMNVNAGIFAFYLIGYNLRHSQIWLSYPRWLSYILISPAQHQIHHSIDRKHWDRNMGLIFAFWDWVFGTLYVPKGYEKLEYGISRDEPNPFGSVTEIYLKPFRMAWGVMRPRAPRRTALLALIAFSTAGVVLMQPGHSANTAPQSPHLEDMTWTEVAAALEAGVTTVIVPTGGTEQNGPHMILGKHNYIVRQASGEIAARLGDTLVAPVIAYVPEGNTGHHPSGHMRWPGTLSLPEPVFEDLLEHTARSLATHGFTRILFIGDSLGNQWAQARVARRLTKEWADSGVLVLHVGDYYDANGQKAALLQDGYSVAQIGQHAGLRDTSELLYVAPNGIRATPVAPPPGADAGYDGAPGLATAELGRRLLELKIEAALLQIRTALGQG
ncbi:MAG: creatininase family protein [Silicimonas sp.]|nr:creatininase family protein [Silicimonas sp.]